MADQWFSPDLTASTGHSTGPDKPFTLTNEERVQVRNRIYGLMVECEPRQPTENKLRAIAKCVSDIETIINTGWQEC